MSMFHAYMRQLSKGQHPARALMDAKLRTRINRAAARNRLARNQALRAARAPRTLEEAGAKEAAEVAMTHAHCLVCKADKPKDALMCDLCAEWIPDFTGHAERRTRDSFAGKSATV